LSFLFFLFFLLLRFLRDIHNVMQRPTSRPTTVNLTKLEWSCSSMDLSDNRDRMLEVVRVAAANVSIQ
jgi:hypothetical protein